MTEENKVKIDAIILAGGELEESLAEHSDAHNKGFIDLGGKPMVQYVIDSVKECDYVDSMVLVTSLEKLPQNVAQMVEKKAPDGKSMIDSLNSGLAALQPPPEYVLILPCDTPFLNSEILNDFISRALEKPTDFAYGFLSRENSEKKYPNVHHTYVKLKEGDFCGTGLFLMKTEIAGAFKALFNKMVKNRKNPIGLAKALGFLTIIKYIFRQVAVADIEAKVPVLMDGCIGRGIETPFAEAGFNVDAPNELLIAKKIFGE